MASNEQALGKIYGLDRSIYVLARTVVVLLITLFTLGAPLSASGQKSAAPPVSRVQPESFYVASFEEGSWTIIDVQPASTADSRIREIRIYPACGTYRVRERDYILENISVNDLGQKSDLCASSDTLSTLISLLSTKKRKYKLWDDRHGTVAPCGSRKVIHQLPARASLRFDVLESKAPQLAALWSLSSEIVRRKVEERDGSEVSVKRWDQELSERSLAQEAVIEIRNGEFDLGLPDAPDNWAVDGKQKLSDLIPDPEEATSPEEDHGVVENIEQIGLEKIERIPYPQMGRIAHIIGDVTTTVRIDAASGEVISAIPLSGHPLLQRSAIDAIKTWKFVHPYFGPNPIEIVVHYKIHCPPIIETQMSSASRKLKKHRPKKMQPQSAPRQ